MNNNLQVKHNVNRAEIYFCAREQQIDYIDKEQQIDYIDKETT